MRYIYEIHYWDFVNTGSKALCAFNSFAEAADFISGLDNLTIYKRKV